MRHLERFDPALVQGYLADDLEAQAMVSFAVANADRGSIGTTTADAAAASYVNPLQGLDVEPARTLLFQIDATDPDTGERHSFETDDEAWWREVIDMLIHEEWRYQPSISVVIDETGGPRSFTSHSPHIRVS